MAAALLWFQLRRIMARLDDLEGFRMSTAADVARLKESGITRAELIETMETTLTKAFRPVTTELKAIRADQIEARKENQSTREKLIRLETQLEGDRPGGS